MSIQAMDEQAMPRFLLKTDQGQWRSDNLAELKHYLRSEFGKRQFLYAEIVDTANSKVLLNVDRAGMVQWTDDNFKQFKGAAQMQDPRGEYAHFMANQPKMFDGGDQP
jgi:hypothetical protein